MSTETLLKTPLHALHIELGARMVPFAGYDMPVQYPLGVMKEHLHTRDQAGLFDVSHMGQIRLTGANAAKALETLVPVDIIDLPVGMQRYAMFTNDQGGILDDLMVANLGNDELFLVVNAACKDQDLAHLRQHIGDLCTIEPLFEERALLALQGPAAVKVLARLAPKVTKMTFMQFATLRLLGVDCYVSRSGYTGEDGFEISVPSHQAEALARTLLAQPEVMPIGLGARDTLRLEAGLCLYGHDINTTTTPVEAALTWAIQKVRRTGGARAGGYPGADVINAQLTHGSSNKRVGMTGLERVPVREGALIVDAHGHKLGTVTSGTLAPTVNQPIALAYLAMNHAVIGHEVYAEVRGKRYPMRVTALPFTPNNYFRG